METLRSPKCVRQLTVLGIVIGVSSVISMRRLFQGLNKFVQDRVDSLAPGPTSFTISAGTDPSGGRSAFDERNTSNTTTPAISAMPRRMCRP